MIFRLLRKLLQKNPHASGTRWTTLSNGILYSPSHLEIIVADHCNLRCRGCNHGSPAVKRWFVEPESVYRDLSMLSPIYRPPVLIFIGGEPLLHKDLLSVIKAARRSSISNRYKLITNGLLLPRMPEEAWELLDEVEVSLYPGVEPSEAVLEAARQKAKLLTVVRFESFRETYAAKGTQDDALVQAVYSACKIANWWGCHGVRDGYFYKCPQSMYSDQLAACDVSRDRVQLVASPDLQKQILALVNSHHPLQSCRHCAGTCGLQFKHEQAPHSGWRSQIEKTLEEIVDYPWLEKCSREQFLPDDCKIAEGATAYLRGV